MAHAAQSLYLGCTFIRWMQYALIFYGATILALFLNFYYQAYIKSAKRRQVCNASLSLVGWYLMWLHVTFSSLLSFFFAGEEEGSQ